jgi:hypothetical protein
VLAIVLLIKATRPMRGSTIEYCDHLVGNKTAGYVVAGF